VQDADPVEKVDWGVLHRRGKTPAAVRHARPDHGAVVAMRQARTPGRFAPVFRARALLDGTANCARDAPGARLRSFTMIRTIAAALAAVVFVAFSAIAAEETQPTTTDAARKETAKERKSAKKAAKKAKKAKKAAPSDTSSTTATPK